MRVSWLDADDDDDDLAYDESSIRSRPNPKANRPRTKRRPAHADAQVARVLGVDRGPHRWSDTMDAELLDAPETSTVEAPAGAAPVADEALVVDELLVEEISIDGMCGVY